MNILTIKATAYDTISELLATDSDCRGEIDGIVFTTDWMGKEDYPTPQSLFKGVS